MSLVKVISTGRSPHLPKGVVAELRPQDAQVLVDKGAAAYDAGELKEKAEVTHVPKSQGKPGRKRKV